MFLNHKDMQFDIGTIDDNVISCSHILPAMFSPKSVGRSFQEPGWQEQGVGQEPRRTRRNLMEQDGQHCSFTADSDSEDSESDEEWVDSDNEVAEDDGDLYEEWVDDKLEDKSRGKSRIEQDNDYDTYLEELQGSNVEEQDSADEVEVVDKQWRKKL
jgi:hypothetical protein